MTAKNLTMRKHVTCFPSTLLWRNLKTQQSSVNLDLCLRKTGSGKSHDHRDVFACEKLCKKMFSVHTKTQSWRFQVPPVWSASDRKASISWRNSVTVKINHTPVCLRYPEEQSTLSTRQRCLLLVTGWYHHIQHHHQLINDKLQTAMIKLGHWGKSAGYEERLSGFYKLVDKVSCWQDFLFCLFSKSLHFRFSFHKMLDMFVSFLRFQIDHTGILFPYRRRQWWVISIIYLEYLVLEHQNASNPYSPVPLPCASRNLLFLVFIYMLNQLGWVCDLRLSRIYFFVIWFTYVVIENNVNILNV